MGLFHKYSRDSSCINHALRSHISHNFKTVLRTRVARLFMLHDYIYLSQFRPQTVQMAIGCRKVNKNPWTGHNHEVNFSYWLKNVFGKTDTSTAMHTIMSTALRCVSNTLIGELVCEKTIHGFVEWTNYCELPIRLRRRNEPTVRARIHNPCDVITLNGNYNCLSDRNTLQTNEQMCSKKI